MISAGSACVLPLLPAIALVVAGVAPPRRRGVLTAAGWCGAGFVAGFVLLALAAPRWPPATGTSAGVVRVVGGALIVLLAVWVALRRPRPVGLGAWLPAAVGLTLAASWTPCIGPELAILLLQVSMPGAVAAGTVRLLVFGAGIMAPVLALTVAIVAATRALGRTDGVRAAGRWVLAALLLLLGVGTAAGRMAELTGYLARFQPWLA